MTRPITVLYVDDDAESLSFRQCQLEADGFTVLTASNSDEGLDIFQAIPVDAVLLDYQMPGIDGGRLAEIMKGLKPDVPIMIVSALSGLPEDAPKCIDAFISKSAPNADLMAEIVNLFS